ncbi:unnamed protein product [Urochloa decumbens]|uniref:SWIM-type domain-containing protein n=1 Tax=Urochloa decumbens TaxID=240449 RepID=A0ABC9ER13_9POAL
MKGSDLRRCACVVRELPQPESMSLVDLQCWIIKLFRLHPETQDLAIKGFFSKGCPLVPNPERLHRTWETHNLVSNDLWDSYVKKVKGPNGMAMFMLCVDSCEVSHYRSLFTDGYDASSQVLTDECQVLPEQECLSSSFPAQYVKETLEKNPAMTMEEIVVYLAETYGKHISHAGAWRAKQKALELGFGTFYDSYNYVPRWLKDITYNDPGNFVDMKDSEVAGCKDFRVLHSIFWAFSLCIQAFVSCRPVLCIKSTSLCGKYQGVLITAIALDANDDYIPVAFAIIEEESKESWLWFLRNVNRAIIKQRSDVCVIHDHKRELMDAVEDLNRQEPHPWRDIQSRWCIQHLTENFFAHYGDNKLKMLFKRLCEKNQKTKFVEIWEELDKLTSKYKVTEEGSASGEMQESVEHDETELEAQSPCNLLDSVEGEEECNDSSDSNSKVTRFSDWIRSKPMQKWSMLYDTNGARYGIMGINADDVFNNHVLKGIQCLPIGQIVYITFQRMVEYYKSRSTAAKKAMGNPAMNFPQRVQDDMNVKMQKSQMHRLISTKDKNSSTREEFKVQLKQRHVIVHLESTYTDSMNKPYGSISTKWAQCSCNKPKLHRKPCSHIIAVCGQTGSSPAAYVSPYYSLTNLVRTWSGRFDLSKTLQSWNTVGPRDAPTWIPNKKMECSLPAFLTSDYTNWHGEEEQQCSAGGRSTAHNRTPEKQSDEPSQG